MSKNLTKKRVINLTKKQIREGDLTLSVLKEYSKNNEKDKEIRKIILSVDSIKVLFPRFKQITQIKYFSDINPLDFAEGISKKLIMEDNIPYGLKLKEIKTDIEKLDIKKELKEAYLERKNKKVYETDLIKKAINDLTLQILHNYCYYLHKFKNF